MSPRRIISFSGRVARIVAYVFAAAVVLFFALTRTEVGREGLRNEVVRQFNESRQGSLEIGRLSGNVLNRLSARDVIVRDSLGRAVITIDSVVLHPTWSAALRRTFSTGRVTLVRPEVYLSRNARGEWNIQSALKRRVPSELEEAWSFRSTRLEVIDGRVVTESKETSPESVRNGILFDWSNATLHNIDGRALVDWDENPKLVDVLEMSGRLADVDLDVDSLRGQVVLSDGALALNEVHLRTTASTLRLNGSIAPLRALRTDPASAVFDIDLETSTIDGKEVGRILPFLPLEDAVTAEARLQGPLNSLVVEDVIARRGVSEISLEGTVLGLPDSIDYEVALRPGSLRWDDVTAIWPTVPVPSLAHLGTVDLAGFSEGTFQRGSRDGFARWASSNEIRLESRAGRVGGALELAIGGADPMIVKGTLSVEDLDMSRVLDRPDMMSRLDGRVMVDGAGPSIREASGRATVSLGPSTWASRGIDTLQFALDGSLEALRGYVFARGPSGAVDAQIAASLGDESPSYRLEGEAASLDVGPLMLSDSLSSDLNVLFTVDGGGRAWTDFEGDIAYSLRPSLMSFGATSRQIPAHSSGLTIRQTDDASPRIVVRGDVLNAEVTGDVDLNSLAQLTRYWTGEIARATAAERSKPYRLAATQPVQPSTVAKPAPPAVPTRTIQFRLDVHRADVLSSFFPTLPELHTDLTGEGQFRMSPHDFDVQLYLTADSLVAGTLESRALDVSVNGTANSSTSLANTLVADFSAEAAALRFADHEIGAPALSLRYGDRRIDVALDAGASDAAAPLRVRARMDLLEDRNRLVIQDFQAAAADLVWTAPGMNVVDFFQEAVHVRRIRVERADGESDGKSEYLEMSGTLSSAPSDTLFVGAHEIQIEHVGRMIGVEAPLGGRLDGRLAYTGLNRQPELTGRVAVEPLSYRNRHLGRLEITSRYIPGSPDVALHMNLLPTVPEDSSLLIEDSQLAVDGTFRLPVAGPGPDIRDPGSLDLDVAVTKADAFFFDYVFRNLVADVTGTVIGSGHVGGDFDSPIFDADLSIRNGRFRIPDFGLTYTVDGPVTIDREGVHLQDLGVTDSEDGDAVVRGSVLFNEYRFFSFDLHAVLDDVTIMNVPQSRDLPFYGHILASGDVSLTGPISNAMLYSTNARTSPESDLYIPISESGSTTDAGFIVFADSMGQVPDFERLTRRTSLLAERPAGERPFLDGLAMDLNILAPEGSTVHLVIDPLLGDVINAVGSGRIQLVRSEGDFSTFGTFTVSSGDYRFTAGEVFFRRFLIDSGTITWDGDPLNAMLAISASYRTRASTEGLGLGEQDQRFIPLVIDLDVAGRVATPVVDLALSIDRDDRNLIGGYEGLEAVLNQPEQAAQYATSVLLTNSFLLSATADQPISQSRGQLAFNSLSQLVASQLNRYLNYALPNVDLSLGVQGESAQDLDVTYGVALRLLDERLIIRGQGIYQNDEIQRQQQGVLDEFVVEVRLNPRVSVEVFYRREGDILSTESLNTSTTGAGLSYQTEFSTWRKLVDRLFGWLYTDDEEKEEELAPDDVVAGASG